MYVAEVTCKLVIINYVVPESLAALTTWRARNNSIVLYLLLELSAIVGDFFTNFIQGFIVC